MMMLKDAAGVYSNEKSSTLQPKQDVKATRERDELQQARFGLVCSLLRPSSA
jgi:hypothetical protein